MLITNINPNKANFNDLKFITRIYATGELYKTLNYDCLYATEDLYNKIKSLELNKSINTIDLNDKAMSNDGEFLDVTLILWREKDFN